MIGNPDVSMASKTESSCADMIGDVEDEVAFQKEVGVVWSTC